MGSRYGLKTRAEIAALKAEEEDKGKKKGKRSARSKTPKSGKKSAGGKKGTDLFHVVHHSRHCAAVIKSEDIL